MPFVIGENSEETIGRVLSSYELGRKIRALRLRKKIALADLGKHTGLSASMLSQLENGKLTPTLPTLARIAMVFDVGMEHFFADRSRKKLFAVVRSAERIRFPDLPDSPKPVFFFECLAYASQDKGLQAYLAEFPAREISETRQHVHDGAEFLFVIDGVLEVQHAEERHHLKAGDSAYFDASEAHAYRGISEALTRVLVITTPPRL